jgi:hypothetical protein
VDTKIHVTQYMIDRGRPRSESCCPVALAIDEELRDGLFAGVNWREREIQIWGPDPVQGASVVATLAMPEDVRKFARAFTVFGRDLVAWEPCSFELDIPEELLKSASVSERPDDDKKRHSNES